MPFCSPAAVTPSSTASALPSLPLELVQLILDFTIPPPGYEEWTTRKSVLRTLALVCRRWRQTYQSQLFGDVVLRSVDSAGRFREALDTAALAYMVTTIRVGSQWEGELKGFDGDASKYELGDIFRRCPKLKTLYIGRMDNVGEGDLMKATSELLLEPFIRFWLIRHRRRT